MILLQLSKEKDASASSLHMECLMDDEESQENGVTEPQPLSRSISGTFQAVPAQIIEDDYEPEAQIQPEREIVASPKLIKERRDFCQSMLKENIKAVEEQIDQTRINKVDLMAEIRRQVSATPAVDEVYSCGQVDQPQRVPVVLVEPMIDLKEVKILPKPPKIANNETFIQQHFEESDKEVHELIQQHSSHLLQLSEEAEKQQSESTSISGIKKGNDRTKSNTIMDKTPKITQKPPIFERKNEFNELKSHNSKTESWKNSSSSFHEESVSQETFSETKSESMSKSNSKSETLSTSTQQLEQAQNHSSHQKQSFNQSSSSQFQESQTFEMKTESLQEFNSSMAFEGSSMTSQSFIQQGSNQTETLSYSDFNHNINRSLEAENIAAKKLETKNFEAKNLEAKNFEAKKLEAKHLEVNNLDSKNLQARNLEAKNLGAKNQGAEYMQPKHLETKDLQAKYLEVKTLVTEESQNIHSENRSQTQVTQDKPNIVMRPKQNQDQIPSAKHMVKPKMRETPKSHSLPRPASKHPPKSGPGKLIMFEATQREKTFSISGLWSNVNLGMVKERSNFWQNTTDDQRTPNYMTQKKKAKRNSRIIDPNEWMAPSQPEVEPEVANPPLHKSLSMGNLEVEPDDQEQQDRQLVSEATVAFEERANGRKSVDIFVKNPQPQEADKQEDSQHQRAVEAMVLPQARVAHEVVENTTASREILEVKQARTVGMPEFHAVEGVTSPLQEATPLSPPPTLTLEANKKEPSKTPDNMIWVAERIPSPTNRKVPTLPAPKEPPKAAEPEKPQPEMVWVAERIPSPPNRKIPTPPTPKEIQNPKPPLKQPLKLPVQQPANQPTQQSQKQPPKQPQIESKQAEQVSLPIQKAKSTVPSPPPPLTKATKSPIPIAEDKLDDLPPLPLPPEVPNRHSSKLVVKNKMPATPKAPPMLRIVSVEATSGDIDEERASELARFEEDRRQKEEAEKRAKMLQEQEKRFYEKLEISNKYRQQQSVAKIDDAPTPPPPPKVDYEKPKTGQQQKFDKLKAQELKERMKLREMERRKRQIEEEIAREKQHLANLLQLERAQQHSPVVTASNKSLNDESFSPPPPPVPPRPMGTFNNPWKESASKQPQNNDSLEATVKDLESTTIELKNMASKKSKDNEDALRQTAGAVREVAQVLLDAVNNNNGSEADHDIYDDIEGYSEGAEEFSCGLEMPLSMAAGGVDQSSGNVTPIPTQGELEEISVEELSSTSPRRTPLKSLLKKSSEVEETQSMPEETLSVRERSSSPRKAVHFSEVDQVKLMSQESLVSTAPSDVTHNSEAQTVNATKTVCTTMPVIGGNFANGDRMSYPPAPHRNQQSLPMQ